MKYKNEKEARALRKAGQSIAAIKMIREANGLGLFEAKTIVEKWPLPKYPKTAASRYIHADGFLPGLPIALATKPLIHLTHSIGGDFWVSFNPPGGPFCAINLGNKEGMEISKRSLLATINAQK